MKPKQLPRILCVDDEPRVLDSLALTLRRDFEVHIATSGPEALRLLGTLKDVAVICSDMRMPSMNGAVLLNRVMQLYPEITRILLTGEPGRDAAVNAVNEGQIFRFLTKPCASDRLKAAIEAGVAQHKLVSAERVLLQETLVGCIKALVDVLAITNPVAFGRASRVKRLALDFAQDLGCKNFWQLDAAAMLSQIGFVSLPIELVEKLYYGERLTPEERVLASAVPQVADKLLGHIPRLEPILQMLAALHAPNDPAVAQGTVALGAQILSIVLDYDGLIAQGNKPEYAIQQLRNMNGKHNAELIDKLRLRVGSANSDGEVRHLALRMVKPGMVFMDELRSEFGVLLVPRGFEVSESFITRMKNYGATLLNTDVRVLIKGGARNDDPLEHRANHG